jgi:prepilin-type N-terminal cleavage/methylation domain-containing protein
MLNKSFLGQRGDTIVEVLIAIAILSTILVGAYVTANRSLTTERNAQEHTQALTIAQGQVEDLYSSGSLSSSDNCFGPDTGIPVSTICEVPYNNQDSSATSTCPATVAYCYQIIDSEISPVGTKPVTYEVKVNWDALGGGKNSVQLYYRPQ